MERYFTFFLYGRKPSEPQAILEFVDWLVQSTIGKDELYVVAREIREATGAKQQIQGRFAEYRTKLEQLSLSALSVSSLKRTSNGAEIFFRYESAPDGPKTITFSVRLDLWATYKQSGLSTQLLDATERLFVSHSCLYGYGNATPYTIPGRFSLIRGNSQRDVPRIADFDYDHYIEDVYCYNYLCQALSLRIDESRLRDRYNTVVVRNMLDHGGARCGLAIYLADCSAERIADVTDCLRPVLWTRPGIQPVAIFRRTC